MTDTVEERACINCACAIEAKHPTLINRSQLLCRKNPPMLINQQGQDTEGRAVSALSLTYAPTSPELVCFDGWRPIGTAPGEKYLSVFPKKDSTAFDALLNAFLTKNP
jgi:hypothetical protein